MLAVHKETLRRLTEITVLRSMTLYSLVIRPNIHAVTRCLHMHSKRGEYEGSSFHRNVGNYQTTWRHTPEFRIILTAVRT